MTSDESIRQFEGKLAATSITLDGVVLMPPQAHSTSDPMPDSDAWRVLFQNCFIGPLEVLKVAIKRMAPDPANGRRAKIVIISGISSAQVLGHYATSNVVRCAWVGEAKTLAFALGARGIHVNTLSLGGTLSPWYREGIEKRAATAGVSFEQRIAEETANIPLGKYGDPAEVAVVVEGLLSPFTDHMTGLNIMHDGGFTRSY
jgi:3-oxoacyl-[acyl-carrier protein] reductase